MRLLYILLFLSQAVFAQADYVKDNEELVFSFKTNNGKNVVLAKSKADKYLVYRFGTKSKIELEYPGDLKDSWSQFKYAYYFRGGGKANAGLEIQNIIFENDGYEYIIYYDYSAEDDQISVGVLVTNTKTNKEYKIIGNKNTIEGSLMEIRESGLLKMADELY
ncbi:hypothetical protein HYN59_04035 [Flavobacterium album]|uniref:DUF4251 domain-containing protein n=1 Tax=Flavobacterium album TaxID=2175091 RepID=A0A2S1QVC5_9FLAO|nr:hypothetical protein [Flavobacterium album]AWH84335.1 hypothetical protein HYN59_04035 [Flavobacterium album]